MNLSSRAGLRQPRLFRQLLNQIGGCPSWQVTSLSTACPNRKQAPTTHYDQPPAETPKTNGSSLRGTRQPKNFRSWDCGFRELLRNEQHAYFDRTKYISTLEAYDAFILFCRPRRFGKSLTIGMLEHFHGLQYADDHQKVYQGLDVQTDINRNRCKPGQYFVLRLDFSTISANPRDLVGSEAGLINYLNSSILQFYQTYATYLDTDVTHLCERIDSKGPAQNLEACNRIVQEAIQRNTAKLAGIRGIYLLVDEYDSLANKFLNPPNALRANKLSWGGTGPGETFTSFWSMVKFLSTRGIRRAFITGIAPLSLTTLGSAFNISRNASFAEELAGLCGLTQADLQDALERMDKGPKQLKEMTQHFNGYHFCKRAQVDTVYNTETCLAYLQDTSRGQVAETDDPENSEVSEDFLRLAASSAHVATDLEKALTSDEHGQFSRIPYGQLKMQFTLEELARKHSQSSWRSLLLYFGALTFDPENPRKYLKIPNEVAAKRIASVILERYQLSDSLPVALKKLAWDGNIASVLSCYRGLTQQTDVTNEELTMMDEDRHRSRFYTTILLNPYLLPEAEFKVSKPNRKRGRVDLVIQGQKHLVVMEWKFFRINFLDVKIKNKSSHDNLAKAELLSSYTLDEVLELRFAPWDREHSGTIQSWVEKHAASQLREYVSSKEVTDRLEKENLELRAHLVIVVGSRQILLYNMDRHGQLSVAQLV